MAGKFFIFEGPDGVGKTTVVAGLKERLASSEERFEFLSFPGRDEGTLGKVVYQIHHSPQDFNIGAMSELAKQALHIAAHFDAIETRIKPLLEDGVNIVLDRFWWSTLVYGKVGGVEPLTLEQLVAAEKLVWGATLPTMAFLVDRDRPINRSENIEMWLKLRSGYAELADKERSNYGVMTLSNHATIEDVVESALSAIRGALF